MCSRSVRWWDEELREIVIDRRACHKQVIEGNKEACSEYCMKCKLLKEKIREKRRMSLTCTCKVLMKVTGKIRMNSLVFEIIEKR